MKQPHTTRLTNTKSNLCSIIITHVLKRADNIEDSSRSVVCTKEQTWRPFCTALRRQHSGASRCENTAKPIHRQSGSNRKTYRFLLFLHPCRHLRHCPVDGGIFMQVRQILAAENGQRLTSIQRPSPKRQFTHFYIKRCSINLLDLLGITAGMPRVLMDESVGVSQSIERG